MKTKLRLLGMLLLTGTFSLTAQTTHSIDWSMSTGAAATITIQVGDAIEWTNIDAMNHNVVSTDPQAPVGFGSGTMALNDTYLFTFNDPVIFSYVCSFHVGTMGGVITVEAVENCAPPTNLVLQGLTATTAEFSWTASPDETQGYTWVVMNAGDNPETDVPVTSGSVPTGVTVAEVSGLIDSTLYDFYVTTLCDGDTVSSAAGPGTFTTDVLLNFKKNTLAEFQFYPNPASNFIYLKSESNIESVSILNSLGQRVLHVEKLNSTHTKIDISNLENGAYFIKINSMGNSSVHKLIKK